MRQILLLCALVGYAIAVPAGTFHQEYSYKASSSSFKNNELQHRTDDQGYYKKDGDLEGRTKPRVDANSEHSEYVNPNLRGNVYSGYGESTDMNSHGLMNAQSGVTGYSANQLAEGIASSDRIVGSRGYTGSSSYGSSNYGMNNYDSNYGSSGYGSSGYQSTSYGSTANIQSIIHRLQQDFEREIQNQQWREAYSQAAFDKTELERQLRRNLTERLNYELENRYGPQTIRNGMSYSIADGQIQSTANYNNQELANLRQQLENNLLNRFRTQYNQGYGTSGSSHYESHSESHRKYGYTSSTMRPTYQTLYPTLPVYSTTQRSTYTNNYGHSNYEVINSNTRYTPVVQPQSISTIVSSVQSQLDNTLNKVLDDIYRQHFSSSASYQLTNYDVVLNRVQHELRNNITYLLDDHIRRNYGSQTQRDGYYYSIGPDGQISNDYNYALRDLEQLKSQVERNLIEKLNRQFETYRNRYTSQSHSLSSQSNYGSYNTYVTTPRYIYSTPHIYPTTQFYTTPRPQYHSNGGQDQYEYVGGSRQSGYEMSGGYSGGTSHSSGTYSSGTYNSANMGQLQRQLQDELSQQLQAAISRDSRLYSSSGSYSPQTYQTSLQHLKDELNRNVTRHLQEYSASASYSASGNYDQSQIENLRSQLLSSLTRQLQQNLQQHFDSSSAYSASSSSNYRPVRGFSNYLQGQYKSGGSVVVGEDYDHLNTNGLRLKRSPYQPYRSRPFSHYHTSDYTHSNGYSQSYYHSYTGSHRNNYDSPQTTYNEGSDQEPNETGQQEMNLGQEIEDIEDIPPQSFQPKPIKVQEENQGQQIQEDEFEPLQTGQQQEQNDLGQQTVDEEFGNLDLGSHNDVGQEIDDSELTQKLEVGEPHPGPDYQISNSHINLGQEIDNSKLSVDSLPDAISTQNVYIQQEPHIQAEYNTLLHSQQHDFGNLHLGTHNEVEQETVDTDLTQQSEIEQTHDYRNYQISNTDSNLGQEIDNSNPSLYYAFPSQNVNTQEEPHFQTELQYSQQHKPMFGGIYQNEQNVSPHHELGQEIDDSDLTQQVEELDNLQVGQQPEKNLLGQIPDESESSWVHPGDQSHSVVVKPVVTGDSQSPKHLGVNSIQNNAVNIWNSHKWKSNQERFIESTKQRLLMKQLAALQNEKNSQYNKDIILKKISANVTKELNSYNEHFLKHYLELTEDEVQGIKVVIFEYLSGKFEEFQKFNQQEETNWEMEQNVQENNLHPSEQQPKPNENLLPKQIPQNGKKQQEEIDISHPQTDVTNANSLPVTENRDWYLDTWTENQKSFVEQIHQKQLRLFNFQLGLFQKYEEERINKKLSEDIEREFSNYSNFFLFNLLGFNGNDIQYIKEKLLAEFRNRWAVELKKVNHVGENHSTTQKSFISHQNMLPQNNVEQLSNNDQIPEQSFQAEGDFGRQQSLDNQQPFTVESQPEQNIATTDDNSQTIQYQFIDPLNPPNPHGLNTIQQSFSGVQYVKTPYVTQYGPNYGHYGTKSVSYLQQQRKSSRLPDSNTFINSENGYSKHNYPMYSQTLNKVLEEENLKSTSSFENNSPTAELPNKLQEPVVQESVSQQPDKIGRVPLHKVSGQWFGLPNQSQTITGQQTLTDAEETADKLLQKLKQKQTRPLAQVVEQPNESISSEFVAPHVNNNYRFVDQTSSGSSAYNRQTVYNSEHSGNALPRNENNRYEGKLNYGRQEEEQLNVETTGTIQPLYYDRANEVQQREPLTPGVKGYRKSSQTIAVSSYGTPGLVVSPSTTSTTSQSGLDPIISEPTVASITDENLPWWKKFGNKIKQGASDLKKKIVG